MHLLTEELKKEILDVMERYFAFYEANDDDAPVGIEANDALVKGMAFFNAIRRVPSDGPQVQDEELEWDDDDDDDDDDLFLSTSVLAKLKGKN